MNINGCIKLFCCILLLGITCSQLMAKTADLGFQVGEITAAEASSAQVEIWELENSPHPSNFASRCYVLVSVKLFPARTINPVDYDLKIGQQTYKCTAISYDRSRLIFFCNADTFAADGTNRDFQLLYIVDGSKLPRNGKPVAATLQCRLSTGNRRPSTVRFNINDIGSRNFTLLKNIPQAGLLK